MSKDTFTTLDGRTWHFAPVSLDFQSKSRMGLRQNMLDEGAVFDLPTYEVELAGGGSQKFDHDEKSVAERNDPELSALWQKYKDDTLLFNARWSAVYLEMLISDGLLPKIRESEAYQNPAWIERHKKYFIEVPEDDEKRVRHFVNLEVFKTTEDTLRFVEAITLLSGEGRVKEEDLERLMSLFRSSLQKKPKVEAPPAE